MREAPSPADYLHAMSANRKMTKWTFRVGVRPAVLDCHPQMLQADKFLPVAGIRITAGQLIQRRKSLHVEVFHAAAVQPNGSVSPI